jgi:hypothetical protein
LGLEKTIRDFLFPCITPQFDYVFVFVEIYHNGVFFTYLTSFLEIYLKKYKFGFFLVKDFNFCDVAKKTKLVIFSFITLQFDFCVFLKINKNGVFSMYYTSFFVVLWKIIEIMFFSMYLFLFFVVFEKIKKLFVFFHAFNSVFFLWKYITTELFPSIRLHFEWFFEKQ